MATAQTIIDRALRLNGRLGAGRSPTANETADCLIALNAMLDSWRLERMMVYAMSEQSLTLTVGDASYTIGTTGDITTTRPVKIEAAFCRSDNIDTPVKVIDEHRWNLIGDKTATGDVVEYLYYNPTMTTGTLNVWPVPSAANVLYVTLWLPLTEFTDATDAITLPPGYERALAYNLAVEISPEYGEGITALVVQIAKESKAAVKRVNIPRTEVTTDLSSLFSAHRTNIERGY